MSIEVTVKIKGQELSLEEAREVYKELQGLFEKNALPAFPFHAPDKPVYRGSTHLKPNFDGLAEIALYGEAS